MHRLSLVLIVVAALSIAPAAGFHSGGVGHCGGCHLMHVVEGVPRVTPQLLFGANASDFCLNCHATASGSTWSDNPLLPGPQYGGGSFAFLDEDNLNDGPDGGNPKNWIPGSSAGHNIIARSRGAMQDPDSHMSPGGTYPSSSLGCTSCHDPHGKGGHFRLLYGSDSPASLSEGYRFQFHSPAPDAVGIDVSGTVESPGNHNAYRAGVSAWCGNCHGRFHEEGSGSAFMHPSDAAFSASDVDNYNHYRGTNFYDGVDTNSYQPLAPYEAPDMTTQTTGPATSSSRVMCLSCHRAHASSGPHSGRWDFNIEMWKDEGANSGSYRIPNPYLSTAGSGQKQLCGKCHAPPSAGGIPPGTTVVAPSRSHP